NYQNWDKVVEASESSTVLKAKVQETNKSGVVVSWKGVRIFIPASQSGLPKEASLNELMGKEISFIIISLDPSRRRVVGSIRAVIRAERKAKQEKFWNEIEVAKQYTGVVKSITAYGAFVDLGGVDGMVHITELSWKRIKHPTDVLNVGDEVTVFVKEFNPETHRISLGYKTEDENPWVILPGKYNVGDTAEVKIVGLTSFGAFAELIPGVDG
ncbi:MAG TPA: bifunctional 4-hydroxy-3-methylbut-2-enyl diphosphate reductase/30S ribosomal protein S1, partial [Clostridiales bacterium]|nr:bifunctional 4-hydroxy-3-methylbut-2-enyl diphosphate reductase/30S ribosomal protein S1 [Clostridiales bacterium]